MRTGHRQARLAGDQTQRRTGRLRRLLGIVRLVLVSAALKRQPAKQIEPVRP